MKKSIKKAIIELLNELTGLELAITEENVVSSQEKVKYLLTAIVTGIKDKEYVLDITINDMNTVQTIIGSKLLSDASLGAEFVHLLTGADERAKYFTES